MDNEIIKIDIDIVNELKKNGNYSEAIKLIKAHQTNILKNKEQTKKEYRRQDCKKYTLLKKRLGLCIACGKPKEPERTNKNLCSICQHKKNKYDIKYKKIYEVKKDETEINRNISK